MYKRIVTLMFFTSLIFSTSAAYAADKNIEALQAQLTEAQSQIEILQKENRELKKRLANKENEAAGYRLVLENLEVEIAALKEKE